MNGVIRYLARDALAESLKQAMAKNDPGMWVRAADFDEREERAKQREVALQDRLTAAEQQLDERNGTCTWFNEDNVGTWNSSCGVTWSFHEDGPAENGMKYCPFCGKNVASQESKLDTFECCLECFGSGTISTGILEASSTLCNKCDGTGREQK